MTNKHKNLTAPEIEIAIYGENGLFDRVIEKIKEITPRVASIETGKTTQHLYGFINKNEKSRPKLETIVEIGLKLGVE